MTTVLHHPAGDHRDLSGARPRPAPDQPSALPGPLRLGRHTIPAPVVLAPMAGITNRAFRRLCREASGPWGADCLYVTEMITARALVAGDPQTLRLIRHDPQEHPRSVQLYTVDPQTAGAAARLLVTEDRAEHIDLNFGCPVPKVTRKGGGAALPWKLDLYRSIVAAVVQEAARGEIPVTVKLRLGIDADHATAPDAAGVAAAEGVSAVTVHGRTAADLYSGAADWSAIADVVRSTPVPVLGNGDVWSASDALELVSRTGCAGVVVGRGVLGRPWLLGQVAAAFAGAPQPVAPSLGEVAALLRRHAEYLVEFYDDESRGCRDLRKHIGWYLKGFPVGGELRRDLALVGCLEDLDELLARLDPLMPWPGQEAEGRRGRGGSPRRVALPEGWLDSRDVVGSDRALLRRAELDVSGG